MAGWNLPGADERPVMQDLKDRAQIWGQFPTHKGGAKSVWGEGS
jgi:hypothetical protein